ISAVAETPGILRVRFTSPHPKDFPPALLQAIAAHPKICKHIHLPLQSGSDRILELMGRTYSAGEYLALVERIRTTIPHVTLTTDIICGFCSESEEDFLATQRLVEQVQFDSAYIFKYSVRPNTKAAEYPDDVEKREKERRHRLVLDLQRKISLSKK
ncbi:MAG: radical SAM protein, partial [candidate division WOR-3 bacterium]